MMSPLKCPDSSSAMRRRSCSSIVDKVTESDVVTDMGGVPFGCLGGHRVLGFGQAAHGVQGGRDGLEVVTGHPVGVLLLGGGSALDALDDQREAEPELEVLIAALDLVGDRAEHRARDPGEDHPVRGLERYPLGEAVAAEVDVAVEE